MELQTDIMIKGFTGLFNFDYNRESNERPWKDFSLTRLKFSI